MKNIERTGLNIRVSVAFALCGFLMSCSDEQQSIVDTKGSGEMSVAPKTGASLVRGNSIEPSSLDPHKILIDSEDVIVSDLYEGLVTLDQDGAVQPGIAYSWETSDNQTFTFKLREDARWSNGEPVVAKDFVFGWRRALAPETASRCPEYITPAKIRNSEAVVSGTNRPEKLGVRAIGPHILEVSLEQPTAYFVSMVSGACFVPLHRESLEKNGDHWTRPGKLVGNGPFELSKWRVNEKIELTRNPYYWGVDKVRIEKVTYLPISTDAEFFRYQSGEVDLTWGVPDDQFASLRDSSPVELFSITGYGSHGFAINTIKPPLNDPKIRKALAYALDREIITGKVFNDGDTPAYTNVWDKMPGMAPLEVPWSTLNQQQRIAEAKKLMAAAGYSENRPLRLKLPYIKSPNNRKFVLAASALWKEALGVEVEHIAIEWKSMVDTVQKGEFDLVPMGVGDSYPDPSSILNHRLTGANQQFGYSSGKFDQIMAEASASVDAEQRAQLYAQAEMVLAEDMPFIPIFRQSNSLLAKPHVRGIARQAIGYPKSKDLWIADQE
ncbi:peptide ABC transporter substrate-binding protein [Biformimicrobium ophioploci]|uniref:ABC transporter substrate-binding protein n=1 Tax=Biformimicrobium ophioploci TaxID=3036711 RepID=A0ABQ6LZL2_9GAMM|nr:peptide ABC transporter substrate-binding protein [Microbulbifer sp. NKW57]GMG87538.1 ABC transporter substrate-binding protein [Microbulbifer sp. NKW57]